jgi:[acyl-carrier-protein] S-malonyltransferase
VAELRRGPRGRHLPPDGGPGSTGLHRWIVQELVTEEILDHESRAGGFTDVADLVDHVTADVTVAERDTRRYYERNPDLYRRPESRAVRHAVLPDQATAGRVAAGLATRDDLGEDLEIRRGELVGPLEDAIFGAQVGVIAGPIRSEHGWHVARVEAVTPSSCIPYAEARRAIEADLLVAARGRAFDEWLEGRREALVTIEPGFEHPAHPMHGFPSHRH